MQSLDQNRDVVVYIQSLLNEGFILPYYNIAKLLKIYHYNIAEIIFIKPKNKQERLTLHSIREIKKGVVLTIIEQSWTDYLPQVYRNDDLEAFLYGFQLSMFKYIEVIDNVEELFTPEQAPDAFIEWLASWFNMTFSDKIQLKNRRQIIYRLTSLYNAKGTKKYLIEMVSLLTDIEIEIEERAILDNFSMINKNLSFVVSIKQEPNYPNDYEKSLVHQIVKEIIESEKPIFTNALFDDSFMLNTLKPTIITTPIIEEKETLYRQNSSEEEKSQEDDKEKNQDKKSGYEDFF